MNKAFVFVSVLVVSALSLCGAARAQTTSLTLFQAKEYYLNHAPEVKNAELAVQQAGNSKTAAIGLLLPSLTADINHNYSFGSTINPATNSRQPANIQFDNFNLNANASIFNLANFLNLRYAQLNRVQAGQQLSQAKLQGVATLYGLYFQYLYNQEWTDILRAQVTDIDRQVHRTEQEVAAGTRAKSDVYDIKANLSTLSEQFISAQNNAALSKNALTSYLRLASPVQTFTLSAAEQQPVTDSVSASASLAQIMQVNPQLRALQIQLQAQQQKVKIAGAGFLPQLTVGYSTSSFYNKNLKSAAAAASFGQQLKNNVNNYVSFGLSLPLFNRLQTRAQYNNEKLNSTKAANDLARAQTNLQQQLTDYFIQVNHARSRYLLLTENIRFQQLSFQKAEQKYKEGMMDAYTFFISRNNWLNAQYNLFRSKYEYLLQRHLIELYAHPPAGL